MTLTRPFRLEGTITWKAATDASYKHKLNDCHAKSVEKLYTRRIISKETDDISMTLQAHSQLRAQQIF